MSRTYLADLPLTTPDTAPDRARDLLRAAQARMGMIPHLYAAMAHSPGLLATYGFGYEEFRSRSGFTPAQQEVVLLTISRFNECTYCVAVHSAIADRSKVPAAVTNAIRDGKPVDDAALGALHDFVTAMLVTRGRPEPEVVTRFLAAGHRQAQALEIILAIAIKTISNYANHAFDTPLDDAFTAREWAPVSG